MRTRILELGAPPVLYTYIYTFIAGLFWVDARFFVTPVATLFLWGLGFENIFKTEGIFEKRRKAQAEASRQVQAEAWLWHLQAGGGV